MWGDIPGCQGTSPRRLQAVVGVGDGQGCRGGRGGPDYISQQAARCASLPAAPAARVWE